MPVDPGGPRRPLLPLDDPASYANPDRECDLVMKGGITSGVVYPGAACRLATSHRFRKVGGASAGAIAAGMTAAAEYARTHPSPTADPGRTSYPALAAIPAEMGQRLAGLFQPAPALRRPYEVLTAFIEPGLSRGQAVRRALGVVVAGAPAVFWGVVLGAVALGALATWAVAPAGALAWATVVVAWVVWLALAVAAGLALAAWQLGRRTIAALPEHGFGLCTGLSHTPEARGTALTEWLADTLDQVAGLDADAGPLTFGHLYGPEATDAFRRLRLGSADAPDNPAVLRAFDPELDLQMMTTCLTLRRPYVFPFRTRIFHWCPDCWAAYFPPRIVAALVAASAEARDRTQRVDGVPVPLSLACVHHAGTRVRTLPSAPDLPVVIGVRLSLSFPVLISAIPFQAIDFSRPEGHWHLVEVWFSDGGITSNFPIHFFDTLLPRRPTFGITLEHRDPLRPERNVWRPDANGRGLLRRLEPLTSVGGFVRSIANTMQAWVDDSVRSAPGFRDRIVEVRTGEGEGGMNLHMAAPVITSLSDRGDEAAREFDDFDFDNHRWIRYRTAMAGLSETFEAMRHSVGDYEPLVASWTGSYQHASRADRAADAAGAAALVETVDGWAAAGWPATSGNVPDPRPQLRPVMRQ